MSLRVALVTDNPGWHGARLREAFERHNCELRMVSLRDCSFDLQGSGSGLCIPGFEDGLPDGVFVRGVPGGTLEQVVLYLDVLHALKMLGVPVYNDGRAIEKSVDKGMTSLLLHYAGVAAAPTWVTADSAQAAGIWARERASGHRLVVKPLFGSQGRGLKRLSRNHRLPSIEQYQGVYYLQRFVQGASFDWRVFVINGRAVACMQRRGRSWINNVAQGGTCIAVVNDRSLERLAEDAAAALDMDYAGVDLIRGAEGALQVIEINSIPAWKGLQAVCGVDIAQSLVDDFFARYLHCRNMVAVSA